MTDRRPHWNDDLIDTMRHELSCTDSTFQDEDLYRMIAAVEDWQDANGFSRAGTLMNRLIDAEAAIQRVREELEAWKGGSVATARILRALDDNKGVNND